MLIVGGAAAAAICCTCKRSYVSCARINPAATPSTGQPAAEATKRTATELAELLAIAEPTVLMVKDRCAADSAFIADWEATRT